MLTNSQSLYLIFSLVLTLCILQCRILIQGNIDYQFSSNDSTKKVYINWAFSPVHMTYLAKEENIIYKLIQNYNNSLDEKNDLLESYINDYIESTKMVEMDDIKNEWERAESISGHPLMTYRMIRRFVYNLNEIINNNSAHIEKFLLDKIQQMNNTFNLPTSTNLEDIIDNILRIHNVYELHAKDLLHGIIAGKKTKVGLTIEQAYELGKHAFSKKMYTEGFDWLENVIIELVLNSNMVSDIDIEDVIDTTKELIIQQKDFQTNIAHDLHNFEDLNPDILNTKINSNSNTRETLKSIMRRYVEANGYQTFRFMDTCNGINVKTAAESSKLYCYFDTKPHPMWKINPLKIEVHSLDPYIIQIYDAIGNKTTEYLQKASLPTMSRAPVFNYWESLFPTHPEILSARSSSLTFLDERDHEPLLNLEKRIGFLTGLMVDNIRSDGKYVEVEASESIQVVAYGFGCHFFEHLDVIEVISKNETNSGDRISTLMLYLNDVESGGYTAFPLIKLAVPPVKHSALLWYNLMKNGETDIRTMHGGCPVILGRKWIATKWIRHNANFRKRPCSLDPLE